MDSINLTNSSIMTTLVGPHVASPVAVVLEHRLDWYIVDALYGGTRTMKLAGEQYMPMNPKEDRADYEFRLGRAVLRNYFKQACQKAADKVFTRDIHLNNVPTDLAVLMDDVDAAGRDMTQFSREVFEDAVCHGVSYILIDHNQAPMDEPVVTQADILAANVRPYWVKVTASNVLEARSGFMNGGEGLVLFRFSEIVSELATNFNGETTFTQIREYKQEVDKAGNPGPVQYTIYRLELNSKTNWIIHDKGIMSTSRIPIVPVYTNRSGFYLGRPPMMDLAYMNLQHWRKRAELDNIMHVATCPFLFTKGLGGYDADGNPIEMDISVHKALNTANKDADVKWIEHTGTAIAAASEDLANLEAYMENLGGQLFTSNYTLGTYGKVSATEKAIHASESYAKLKAMALGLQDALDLALAFTGEYLNIANTGTCTVNTLFHNDTVTETSFNQLVQLFNLGIITPEVMVQEAKRRNIIDATIDVKIPVDGGDVKNDDGDDDADDADFPTVSMT